MTDPAPQSPSSPPARTTERRTPLPARRTSEEVDALVPIILERMRTTGDSVKAACRELNVAFDKIWDRLGSPRFAQAYQEAFALRTQLWAEGLRDMASDRNDDRNADGKGNMAAVARSRLEVDTTKWLLSKLIPRQYGDTLAVTGADGGPLQISWAEKPILDITPDEPNS